jgi:hypothetical protein
MKRGLFLVMIFSIAFAGCRKEVNQVVSRPLNEVKDSVVAASPTPTPTPSPTSSPKPRPSLKPYTKPKHDYGAWCLIIETVVVLIGAAVWDIYRWHAQQRAAGVVGQVLLLPIDD